MDCARPQATLHRAIEMDEATEPIRQHSVLVEASLFTLEPESREERLRRIEVIAGRMAVSRCWMAATASPA